GRAAAPQLARIGVMTLAAMAIAWLTATALWPWLQLGNPFTQYAAAYSHFLRIPMEFSFPSWGEEVATNALPWYYIPSQFLARLPEVSLLLLIGAALFGIATAIAFTSAAAARYRAHGIAGLRAPALALTRSRGTLLVIMAATVPPAF